MYNTSMNDTAVHSPAAFSFCFQELLQQWDQLHPALTLWPDKGARYLPAQRLPTLLSLAWRNASGAMWSKLVALAVAATAPLAAAQVAGTGSSVSSDACVQADGPDVR